MAGIVRRLIRLSRAPRVASWLAPLVLVAILVGHTGTCTALLTPPQAASEIGVVCHHASVDDLDYEASSPTGGASLLGEPRPTTGDDAFWAGTGARPKGRAVTSGPPTPSIVAIGISRT